MYSRVLPTRTRPLADPAVSAGGELICIEALGKAFPARRTIAQIARHPFDRQRNVALDGVTLRVRAGEILGLLGPNGAGKTTLFKILATLILPDSGSASVAGYDVVRDAARVRRALALVIPDERSLMWRISARENLRLYAALYGLHGRHATERVDALLRLVELADQGAKMVGQFSTGMKQRLLLARGLLGEPQVLLLDEPTRSLDPVAARTFREFIRSEIAGTARKTIVMATHNAEEALELCDRIAILDRGRVLVAGPPEELALEDSEERYRIWTTEPPERITASLVGHGLRPDVTVHGVDRGGWQVMEVYAPGGLEQAARLLSALVSDGIAVARCEQVRPSLAELIAAVVDRSRTHG